MTSYLPATDANTARTRSALSAAATFSKPKSTVRSESAMAPLECVGRHCSRLARRPSGALFRVRVSGRGAALQIARPIRLKVASQLVQHAPGIKTGIVAVVEEQAQGIVADRLDAADPDVLLARSRSAPSPPPWPFTSAEGEKTRRYSNGSSKCEPSSNRTSSRRDSVRSLISVGCATCVQRIYRDRS